MPTFRTLPAAIAAVVLVAASPAASQEFGVTAVRASSGNAELPAPAGFAVSARFALAPWVAEVALVRTGDDTRKAGQVCQAPGVGCRTEEVAASTHMNGLRLALVRPLVDVAALRLTAGLGASVGEIRATALGSSGRRASLHVPHTAQVGLLASTALSWRPAPGLPVALVGGVAGHWVRMNGCVDPGDPTRGYAPFCGWQRFLEAQAGLAVAVPLG